MIRTVLVDDEEDSVKVLRRLLETYCPDISIVGQAEGVETAFDLIRSANPDLVFLDIEMIQGNAFDLLNRLQPLTFQVIFVTAFDNYAVRAFRFSAVDYLLKPVDAEELRSAVGKVVRQLQDKDIEDSYDLLTPRERELLQLIAEGKSNKDVANMLNLSLYTVETHRSNILNKLNLHSVPELILYAVRKGVIS